MHGLGTTLSLTLLIAYAGAALAASDRNWKDCAQGSGEQAIAGCTRFIEDRSESAKDRAGAYLNRAVTYRNMGDLDRAIADYDQAIMLDPRYARAYYQRGMVYRQKGDVGRAINDFRTTLQLDSSATPARKALQELESAQSRPPIQTTAPASPRPAVHTRPPVSYSVIVAGLELAQLDDALHRHFNIPADVSGAVVLTVREPIARSSDPIVPGQVIVGIREAFSTGGQSVYSPADVFRNAEQMHNRSVREVELESKTRDGQLRMIWFNLPIAPPVELTGTAVGATTPATSAAPAAIAPSAQPSPPPVAQAPAASPSPSGRKVPSSTDPYELCVEAGKKSPMGIGRVEDAEGAVKHCSAALSTVGSNYLARYDVLGRRARAFRQLGRMNEAVADAGAAVQTGRRFTERKFKENYAFLLQERAELFLDLGRFKEALADIDAADAIIGRDKDIDSLRLRAMAAEASGNPAEAVRHWTKVAENFPKSRAAALSRRAWNRGIQGDVAGADADLDEVERTDPSVSLRPWLYAEIGKLDLAALILIKAQQTSDDRMFAVIMSYLRGHIEAARANFGEAVHAFGPATVEQPKNATVQSLSYLLRRRAGLPDNLMLMGMLLEADRTRWPDAIAFHVMSGSVTRAQLDALARHGNPRIEKEQRCTFHLIAGQTALARGDNAAARTDLEQAVETCKPRSSDRNDLYNSVAARAWAKGDLVRLGGTIVHAPAPIQGRITIVSATLGANCGVKRGNVTDKVAAICNGKETCALPGTRVNNPDPAFGCPKAFAAEWICNGKPGTRKRGVPAIANEKHVLTMSCK